MNEEILNKINTIPLTLLVRETGQKEGDFSVCECPFCKDKPHLRIQSIRRESRKEWLSWECPTTNRKGNGSLSLYSAMHFRALWGNDLKRSISELAQIGDLHIPELDMPEITDGEPDSDKALISLSTTFTTTQLLSLGFGNLMKTEEDEGFISQFLQQHFQLFPVVNYKSAPAQKGSLQRSTIIHSRPWSPAFALFTDDSHKQGRMLFPMQRNMDFIFSLDKKHKLSELKSSLLGDLVFMNTKRGMTVPEAVEQSQIQEEYAKERKVWTEDDKGNMQRTTEPIPDKELKVAQCVFFDYPLDAISAFVHLNWDALHNLPQKGGFYHSVFLLSSKMALTRNHADSVQAFADRVYYAFANSTENTEKAYRAGRRFRFLKMVPLPDSFMDMSHLNHLDSLTGKPSSLLHFFLTYRMTPQQRYNFSSLTGMYRALLSSAVETDPFEYVEKRDRKGHLQDYFYRLKPPSIWAFMRSEGYCRDVDMESPNKIGRFIRIEKPFAEELDTKSLIMRTQQMLINYAGQIARPGTDDYEKMVTAVLTDRTVNEKTATSLPSVSLDYRAGYGRDIDHFFYLNGALRITKDSIRMIPYDKLDFHVDKAEVMPWNFNMPVAEGQLPPVEIMENPEYLERKEQLEQHRKDGSFSVWQIAHEHSALLQWAQSNRWKFDWHGTPERERWPILRVLRGFANEDWQEEEELLRNGEQFSPSELAKLDGRLANIFFGMGRVLWRYRISSSNCIPYLLENKVSKESRAEGGSGKSVLVNTFCACAGKVYRIDCRSKHSLDDLNREMGGFRPHCHRIIHWEDLDKSVDFLYNYATGDTTIKRMYADNLKITLAESPGHIVSSNIALASDSDSTVGRICTVGFSHRFARMNVLKNKPARLISDIFPGFNTDVQSLPPEMRDQIAYICAVAVQFVMRYDERIDAPQEDILLRTLNRSLGESFVEWADAFFDSPYAFHFPYDTEALFRQFRDFAESAEGKKDLFSLRTFKDRLKEYCQSKAILMNPDCCYPSPNCLDQKRNRIRRKCWTIRTYFEDRKIWSDRPRKDIWELNNDCQNGVFFSKEEIKPKDYEDFKHICNLAVAHSYPNPFRDGDGNPIYLTVQERMEWDNYVARMQRRYGDNLVTNVRQEDMPF